MTTEHPYGRVRAIFMEAQQLPPDQLDAFLERACGGDESLEDEVRSLLHADRDAGDFLSGSFALSSANADAWVGRRIGSYTIRGVLAEGGMGVVFDAVQETPRRRVAIKLIGGSRFSDTALLRFELEAEVLGRLDHPGIAQIFEAGTTSDEHGRQPYLAMEFIEGRPLIRYATEEQLSVAARLELMIQLCDAVHHAHQNGVIHRDLKPANILVRGDGRSKVLDFGVARVTDADLQATTLHTDVGQVIGTLPYMSPEQVGGRHDDLDTRSDVYALGVLCYELLTGRLPQRLRDKTLPEAARIIAEEEPGTLSGEEGRYPADLETIVGKALEKEKTRRYASAAELAADLRRFLDHEPIAARPPSASYQLRKFARRNRGLVATGAVAVSILVVGLVVSVAGWSTANRERQRSVEEAEKALALNQFLVEMIDSADPVEAGGEVRMVDVLGEAGERIELTLGERPEVAANAHRALGDTYKGMGLPDRSEPHLSRALELMDGVVDDPTDPRLHRYLSSLLFLYLDQGRLEEADATGVRLRAVMARLDPESLGYLRGCHMLGELEEVRGDYAEAVEIYTPCFETARRAHGEDHTITTDLEFALANSLWQAGRLAEARDMLESFHTDVVGRYGTDHPVVLSCLNNLGSIYQKLEDHDNALRVLQEGLAIKLRVYGEDSGSTAIGYHNLANQLRVMGRPDEAPANHEKAIAIAGRVFGGDDSRSYMFRAGYGSTLFELGRLDEAEAELGPSFDALSQTLGSEHPRIQTMAARLADLHQSRGDAASAARYRALAGTR